MASGRHSSTSQGDSEPPRLSEFIRAHQADILAAWEDAVRQLPVARDLDRPALLDHLPHLLARIADMADVLAAGGRAQLPTELAEVHALERLEEGFDLAQVVAEYAVLRDCIVRQWSGEAPIPRTDSLSIRALNQAIDRAIASSVQRYTIARDRTLQSLDRISAAALETRNLDDFLDRLLRVLLETTAAVDTAAILLCEGDVLRVRASAGLGCGSPHRWSVRVGEGFVGLIAETGRPQAVTSAATDPLVLDPHVRAAEVKGLFGVPLVEGGEVIGVAHMGSFTAREFSKQDQRMIAAMAHRATAAISLHMLREAADRRARQQQAIAALGVRALGLGDLDALDALYADVVRGVTETLGVELAAILQAEPDGTLVVRAEAGWGPEIVGVDRIPRDGRTPAAITLGTGEPVIVDDLSVDARFELPALFRDRGIHSAITVPIRLPGEPGAPFGVLAAHTARLRAFGSEDTAFLQAAAHILGTAIALRRALAQQQDARLEAERNLAVLDTILTSSSLGIGFLDTDLRYVRVNDALAALNGLSARDHVGRTVHEVLGAPTAELLEPLLRQILATRRPAENLALDAPPPMSAPGQVRSFLANYVPVVTPHDELLGVGAVVVEVTERKRMELALREREQELRSIADNIPQLAWMTDETGSITWYNRRWYEFTGTAFEETRGWGWQVVHHPDHRERVTEKFRRHLASGEVWEDTFPLRAADGRYRWFLSRAVPIRDEDGRVVRWFGTNTDVTEQRFMHEAMALLSSSLDYRETLGQLARLAVPALGDWCAVDLVEAGRISRVVVAHADPAKPALAGELAAGSDPDRSAPAGVVRVIETGATEAAPGERVRSYVIAPLVARGRTLGALSFASAESGRRYTPADLGVIEELGRRAGLAIDNARLFEEAQRAARMREEILAVVSHDLKNPLGAIHLAATILLQKPGPASRKHLEAIDRSARRMDHLITDLLDMASIQAGRLAIERKPEDLDAIVREVHESHEPMAKEKDIALVRACELSGVPVSVDRDRILQVFGNLLGNALKFCCAGDTITLRGERRGDEVELAVENTGPPISEAELPHVFEPYWSAKQYAKQGTGLGLYISKGIVEAHGGRIRVESGAGLGVTFYFTLPVVT